MFYFFVDKKAQCMQNTLAIKFIIFMFLAIPPKKQMTIRSKKLKLENKIG